MKSTISIFFIFFYCASHCQSQETLPEIMKTISGQWKLDSNSCNGFRKSVVLKIMNAKTDVISKRFLQETLGPPNSIQQSFRGEEMKRYEEYIYFIYKERCPELGIEAASILFIFEEGKDIFIGLDLREYCG
jgi:hypothetical protein